MLCMDIALDNPAFDAINQEAAYFFFVAFFTLLSAPGAEIASTLLHCQ
jgi:hypothetical protein